MFDLKKSLDTNLKEDWENLFKSLGVESIDELIKGGKKDKTKLIPVKKQITRGGKTIETTVYVSPKEAEEMKEKKKTEEDPKKKKLSKDDYDVKTKKQESEMSVVAPHDDVALKELHKQLDSWKNKEVSQALKDASKDYYLLTAKSGGKVVGVGAFKRKGNALHMEHFGSTKEQQGVGKQLVRHLLAEAGKRDLGVSINPPKASTKFLTGLGFKDNLDGVLTLDPEEVKTTLNGKTKEEKEKPVGKETEKTQKESKGNDANKNKEETNKKSPEEEKQSEHKKLTKKLRSMRKQLGSDQYRAMLEHYGIKWEKVDHQGVNTMRATMAAAEFVKGGGKLSVNSYLKSLEKAEKEETKKSEHDLDKDYFDMWFDKSPSGREVFMIQGQPKSLTGLSDEDKGILKKLSEIKSQDEFTKFYYKLEDEGKLSKELNGVMKDINERYKLKEGLFKEKGYRVALGRSDADKLGENLNSNTQALTQDEETAILNYTGSQSTVLNRYFREQNKEPNEHLEELSHQLDTVLSRNELTEDVMIYRGAGFPAIGGQMAKDILTGNSDKYIGAEITDLGYMSTSLGAVSMFQGDVTFQIKAPKGTKGMYLEKYTATRGEQEVLLPRGTTLKVQEIKTTGSKINMLVEVIGHGEK